MDRHIGRHGRRFGWVFGFGVVVATSMPVIIRADEGDAERAYLTANGLLNRGLYDLAAAEYESFLSSHPDHEKADVARYGLGVCRFRLGDPQAAGEALEPVADQRDFAFGAEASFVLAQCRFAQGQYKEAVKSCDRVTRRHADHELVDDAAYLSCEALFLAGDHQRAADRCDQAVRRWEDSSETRRGMFFGAYAQMALGNYADAAARFEALASSPNANAADASDQALTSQTQLLLAQCLHRQGRLEDAGKWYRKSLTVASDADMPDAMLGYASLLGQMHQPREASAIIEDLLKRFPGHRVVCAARVLMGRSLFEMDQVADARRQFELAAGEPDDSLRDDIAYWIAKCDLRSGDAGAAEKGFDAFLQQFGDSDLAAEAQYDRAVSLLRDGDDAGAIPILSAFVEDHPDHVLGADALRLLAWAEHRTASYDACRRHCRQFLQRFDENASAAEVRFLSAESDFLEGKLERAVTGFVGVLESGAPAEIAAKAELRLGTALYRLERFDEAEPMLARSAADVEGAPADVSVLLCLGDIAFRRGAWKQAQQYLTRYLDTGTGESADEALLRLGLCMARQSSYEAALAAFDQLLKDHPQSVHRQAALFEKGQALVGAGDGQRAVDVFEEVVAEGGSSRFVAAARNHLGVLAMQRADYERAQVEFAHLASDSADASQAADALFQQGQALLAARHYSDAEAAYGRFLARFGDDGRTATARGHLAIALSRQDKHEQALDIINQLQRMSGGGGLEASLMDSIRYERAWCLRAMGKSADAAVAYRELLGQPPAIDRHASAALDLAVIEAEAGRCEAALAVLSPLLDVEGLTDAVREQALYRQGICQFELEQFDRAVASFETLLSAFTSSDYAVSAAYFCGESQYRQGAFAKAASHFAAVADAASIEEAMLGPCLLRWGDCLAQLQRWARSEEVFDRFLQRFASAEHAYQARFGVGWARENQGRYDDAIAAYREVAANHRGPTAARSQFQIGECLFAQRKHETAIAELLKVDILYAYPEWSAAALYEAGRCFQELGKTVEARDRFREVGTRAPDSKWAKLASRELDMIAEAPVLNR